MSKFTKKQLKDLETIEYFIPAVLKDVEITDEDRETFLLISERGIRPKIRTKGVKALEEGKSWRGVHMFEIYQPGVMDGSMPYFVILGGYDKAVLKPWYRRWFSKSKYDFHHNPVPRSVVDFMKKEMFKGHDAELIEKTYNFILNKG